MKKLLLTGFEPFLDNPINPTEQIVKELDGKKIGNYTVKSLLLPVDFEMAPEILKEALAQEDPDALISLGLAAGRNCITPERVAINCRSGEPDNRGNQYEDAPIEQDGPAAYFSKLPIREMVRTLKENDLPADISNTAGTYLCNNVMYTGLHYLAENNKDIPAGFIHIPASHELAAKKEIPIPSWSMTDLIKGIRITISCLK